MTRIFWGLSFDQLYGKYPLLGQGRLPILIPAASVWQGGNNKNLRIPRRWIPGAERFLDSGGFALLTRYPHYPFGLDDYLGLARRLEADWIAARDVPCEPWGRLKTPVKDRIQQTVDAAVELLEVPYLGDYGIQPVSVIQGWTVQDYLSCVDQLRERDALTDLMAVGSCCKRTDVRDVFEIARAVRSALPSRIRLHFFGLKTTALADAEFREIAYSVDTSAWTFGLGGRYEPWTPDGHCSVCGKTRIEASQGHLHRQIPKPGMTDAFYQYLHRLNESIRATTPAGIPVDLEAVW